MSRAPLVKSIKFLHDLKGAVATQQMCPSGHARRGYRLTRAQRYHFSPGSYMLSRKYQIMGCLDHKQACKPETL